MGLLKFFSKSNPAVQKLPSGSLTVDRFGNIVTSTVPSSCPTKLLRNVTEEVLNIFREARAKQMAVAEISLHFASLRITARELRGGALIFLSPKTTLSDRATSK
jgi:hypothetical protein